MSSQPPGREPSPHSDSFQPRRSAPARPPQKRRKSAAERRKDRLRIVYLIVAVAMILLLLAGVFAPTGAPVPP